ncbi:MAG: hypothetical protein ACRDHL_08940 [Candidatus Promineifilaceae bacterium]
MAHSGANSGLTAKQRRVIEALLSGLTKGQAAAAAGVAPRTMSRWLALPAFQAELSAASDDAVRDATRRLVGTLDTAISVLQDVMDNPAERAAARLRAAELVISRGQALLELRELAQRIQALEERLNEDA